jgi:hypothetical protein
VYIYGTEEIDGLPAITMELAPGGTLKDRVKKEGPFPPAEAVDAILQIIAGLDAASATGVLHRDVKPSNCFVDGEGRVKVGDFGLSISTLAHAERDVTTTGAFLGTPAFASPEQLRCEPLDVRSDIYAVGATLYYLLTGRAPFQDDNIFKLATRIARDAPEPVRSLRSDVAPGLARVVTRCMAKEPADRIETYSALAAALEPFSSAAPVPAGVGRRAAAGVVDWFVLGLLLTPLAISLQWVGRDVPSEGTGVTLYVVLGAAYFGLLESRFGASIGKALCGLGVIDRNGGEPTLWRALGRSALFFLGIQSLNLLSLWAAGFAVAPTTLSHPPLDVRLKIGSGYTLDAGLHFEWLVGFLLLFVFARRGNGFAGLHELATATRVVMKPALKVRSAVQRGPVLAPPPATSRSVGSYQVLERLSGDLQLGYDGRLQRKVWIERHAGGAPALPPHRRDLSRPARLHWLNGRRTAEECWDVYEACEGTSLLTLLNEPQPWGTLRHWLRDLTVEFAAGLKDQSLPDLGLDRVWITPEGRAKLLDWPAPDIGGRSETTSLFEASAVDLESAQQFLNDVALSALQGRVVPREARLEDLSIGPLPLSARGFLQRLGRQAFQTPQDLADAAASVAAGPAVVTRRRRLLHTAICSSVPAVMAIYTTPLVFTVSMWVHRNPDLVELTECLDELRQLERLEHASQEVRVEGLRRLGYTDRDLREVVHAYEIYLSGRHRRDAVDPSTWSQPFIRADQRALAERVLAGHPHPLEAEVDDAKERLTPFFDRVVERHPSISTPFPRENLGVGAAAPLASLPFVAVPALLSAAVFRGGLLLRAIGVCIVTTSGISASRPRAFIRAAVAWAPGLVLGLDLLVPPGQLAEGSPLRWFILPWQGAYVPVAAALVVGLVWAILDPSRGLQDRLAGTHLVPR